MNLLLKNYFKAFFQQFEKGNNNAAALAYFTLFSVFPLFYLALSLTEKFFGEDQLNTITSNFLQQLLGSTESVDFIEFVRSTPYFHSNVFLDFFSVLMLLFSCSSIMVSVKKSMNQIFEIPQKKIHHKKILKETIFSRFYSLSLLSILAFTIILFETIQIFSLTFLERLFVLENWISMFFLFSASIILSFCSNMVILYLIYKKSCDIKIENKLLKKPVVLTAIFLSLSQYVLKFYLNDYYVFSDAGLTGSILILLLWIYIFATFIYGGAFYLNQLRCITKD